jgi:hypothetical protein
MRELFGQLDTAIYETVHGYRDPVTRSRGAAALAPKLGMPPGSLSYKADPTNTSAKFGLIESVTTQLVAGDFQILHAYTAVLGHCAWCLPPHSNASDVELLEAYASVHAQMGQMATAIRDALSDRRVTRVEVAAIRMHFDAQVRAGLELLARLEALAE